MNVLIKNMKLPKEGLCKILTVYADGTVYDHTESGTKEFKAAEILTDVKEVLSSQAAIDACFRLADDDGWLVVKVETMEKLLKALLPSEPEKCEDCGNFNKTQLLIPQQEPQRWIPVSEDKPEPFQEVLVTLHENGWNGETYDTVKSQAYDGDYKITAWMPLPQPYKENEE